STASEAQGSTDPPATSSNAAFAESARTNTKSARMDAEFDQPRTSLHTASVTEAAASHNTDSTQAGEEAKTSLMAETKTTLVISPSKTASETLTTTAKCLCDPGALVGRGQTDGRLVSTMVNAFCNKLDADKVMKDGDECIVNYEKDRSNADYALTICRKKNCTGGAQNVRSPFSHEGVTCPDILYYKIWMSCSKTNKGNGGWFDAGCLEYGMTIG
ncbi:hypothetical protein EDB81DRAFT_588924, partial [Dactylonectria macrodidyma]